MIVGISLQGDHAKLTSKTELTSEPTPIPQLTNPYQGASTALDVGLLTDFIYEGYLAFIIVWNGWMCMAKLASHLPDW